MLQIVESQETTEEISERTKKELNEFLTKKRREIVNTLAERGELSHGELAKEVGTSNASLSNILLHFFDFRYKLIDSKTEGKYRKYYITDICRAFLEECANDDIRSEKELFIRQDINRLEHQTKMILEEFKKNDEEFWELKLDDAFTARTECKKIEIDGQEQLVSRFIINVEKLLLYDYGTYCIMVFRLLGENSILRGHFERLLSRFEAFIPLLEDWKKEEETLQVFEQIESAILAYYKTGYKWKVKDDDEYKKNSELSAAMSEILDKMSFHDKKDIYDFFMGFLAGDRTLSGYVAQMVWNIYQEREKQQMK